ncbi:MAG: alanine racemase, partial [Candidatus Eremiobacteraeota bacterium]|nr:alanine racemase [Candidatus Eremiobacteraeota bacterium]
RRLAAHDADAVELDVCSLGEIVTAERGGFPAQRMYLHGCGKSEAELEAALEGRVGALVVDGIDELRALGERAGSRRLRIGLRINTGIVAHTHDFVRTGGENTKFGILPQDLPAALTLLDAHRTLELDALHAHIGSQIFDEAPYATNLEALLDAAAAAHANGRRVARLILGGGFGVDEDVAASQRLDLRAILAGLARRAAEGARRRRIPVPALGVEPGRALVATAGTSLYTVVAIKDSGSRRFVVIDGGIADNPRPAIYGAFHQPLVAWSEAEGALCRATVAGRSCENDELVDADLPAELRAGDLLALCTTGAYTYSMASNYNRFPRPAVVEVGDASHRPIARRETLEDVTRNDILA